ncbi:MAG: hypothetical protein IPO40_00220 [Fibrobacteres bacterium]|nr:hypothetical protein [Fibrobacterota bacterium]
MNRASLVLIPLLMGLCCCDDDRSAGGTGTETGSAVTARFVSAEGKPETDALVEARLSGSNGREFRHARTDDSGRVVFRLENGEWTLVAFGTGTGAKFDFKLQGSDMTLPVTTLRRTSFVTICPEPGASGTIVSLKGTGWSGRVGGDACARFDSLPYGGYSVEDGTGSNWRFELESGMRDSLFQVPGRQSAWFRNGRNARWDGTLGMPLLVDLPGGSLDTFPEEWFGADGSAIPERVAWERGDGSRRSWIQSGTKGTWVSRRRVWGSAPVAEFLGKSGATGAWSVSRGVQEGKLRALPDLMGGPALTLTTPDSVGFDGAQGWYMSTFGSAARLALDSSKLPRQGGFGLLLHVAAPGRTGKAFRWTGPDGRPGIELESVPLGYRFSAPGVDTIIDLMNGSSFHAIAVSFRNDTLQLGVDGIRRLSVAISLADRRDWAAAEIGVGAGLRITQIATFRSGVDVAPLSNPPGKLSIE